MASLTASAIMAPTGSASVKASRHAKVAAPARISRSAFTPQMAKPLIASRQSVSRQPMIVTNVAAPGRGLVEGTKGQNPQLEAKIREAVENKLQMVDSALEDTLGEKTVGKVRDMYTVGNKLVAVATDRQSAFDRVLTAVPFKGQVLQQSSMWWFKNTEHIVNNAVLASPDPYVIIYEKCKVFPVEFVMRGYMTGSTETSLWTNYKNGVRNYCGHALPDGMVKSQKLPKNLLTPTTKSDQGDQNISAEEIVAQGLMSQAHWDICAKAAEELFAFGQQEAAKRGLILVDTKYEFGMAADGSICIIDEVHTPDSSRYWVASSFEERLAAGENPENIDKEFLRLWYKDNCDPYNDAVLPEAPVDLVSELSRRYILLYETITGQQFEMPPFDITPQQRMAQNTLKALQELDGSRN